MIAFRSSDFVNHSYDRLNWTLLSPITIPNSPIWVNKRNFRYELRRRTGLCDVIIDPKCSGRPIRTNEHITGCQSGLIVNRYNATRAGKLTKSQFVQALHPIREEDGSSFLDQLQNATRLNQSKLESLLTLGLKLWEIANCVEFFSILVAASSMTN